MSLEDKMVDYPAFDPKAHVAFPPDVEGPPSSTFAQKARRRLEEPAIPTPYYEGSYSPDPPTPNASRTTQG